MSEENARFCEKSQKAELKCQDFNVTFNEIRAGDIVYCDPPYVPLSITSSFTSYSKNDFNIKDQESLARNAELLQTKE